MVVVVITVIVGDDGNGDGGGDGGGGGPKKIDRGFQSRERMREKGKRKKMNVDERRREDKRGWIEKMANGPNKREGKVCNG
uniref:Uncharacterized protein n=1 Tax=Vespula pensylvanica TaxID=30213 RepID=A0A834KW76_VESPE|nr:hypothetical protein H0235_012917 [Vespula pensylvanica]